jgi:PHD/YefM family antitoxin component YafN of YafNO toxin-antitoxin module
MLTKLIGVKEFRQNISELYKKAKKNKWQYVVLNRNQPIFKVFPLSEKDAVIEKLAIEIEEAREDVKKDNLYTAKQVRRDLNL